MRKALFMHGNTGDGTERGEVGIFRLIASFFKVGVIGFGGGSALIPIIRNELVVNREALCDDDYLKHTVVVNITPGALPVKLGATCGFQLDGPAGSLLGAYSVALPGVLATVLIIALFSLLGESAIHCLNHASVGITIFIVFLLLNYVGKTVWSGNRAVNTLICLLAFLVTGGREMRDVAESLFGLPHRSLGVPLLNISMIHVMILSFYLIFHFQLAGRTAKAVVGAVLALAYAFLCGDMIKPWPYAGTARLVVTALFVVSLVLLVTAKKRDGEKKKTKGLAAGVVPVIGLFLALPLVPVAAAWLAGRLPEPAKAAAFLGNILVSTVTSFGGGEAYVAVADSIFVQGGYVKADIFYGQIVPVANALPGPILVKIAAAIGFVWGQAGGSLWAGALLAAACAMLAIGACCAVAMLVLNFYEALRHSVFVMSLKRYILPVICGTLASTSLAMLYESMKIAAEYHYSRPLTFAAMAMGIVLTFWLHIRYRIHDIVLLIGWVVASLVFMALTLGTFSEFS